MPAEIATPAERLTPAERVTPREMVMAIDPRAPAVSTDPPVHAESIEPPVHAESIEPRSLPPLPSVALPSFNAAVLGARIAALRQRHGWTQRRLAEEAGVSHGYVAQLELGRLPNPGKSRLDAIAHALLLRTSDALLGDDADDVQDGAVGGAESVAAMPKLAPGAVASRARTGGATTSSGEADGSRATRDEARGGSVAQGGHGSGEVGGVSGHATHNGRGGAGAIGGDGGNGALGLGSEQAITNAGSTRDEGARSESGGRSKGGAGDAYAGLGGNVLGMIDQVRGIGARQLPVFRWGSCGDPRDRLSPPDPDRLEYPPPGRESLIGENGFGVVVKGDSMAGRGIHDGDVVWVNPDRPYALGKVVLALATSDEGGEAGMVVKTYARTEVGECLVSETDSGRSPLVCHEFKVIGPVVGITSWRLPS